MHGSVQQHLPHTCAWRTPALPTFPGTCGGSRAGGFGFMDGCVPSRACGHGAESGIGPRRALRVAGIRGDDEGGRNSSPPPRVAPSPCPPPSTRAPPAPAPGRRSRGPVVLAPSEGQPGNCSKRRKKRNRAALGVARPALVPHRRALALHGAGKALEKL